MCKRLSRAYDPCMLRGMATLGLAVAAITCGVAPAQFKLGQTAKKFKFDKVWNDGPKDFAALHGKVVVMCIMHSEVDMCRETVPRLKELHAKYAKRGLLVIGVSDEAANKTQDQFMKGLAVDFPWVKANKVVKQYKVKFWPTPYCLDSYGAVRTVPDTGVPLDIEIEELLLAIPPLKEMPKGSRHKKLRTLWQKWDYSGLSVYLDKNLSKADLKKADGELLNQHKAALAEQQKRVLARIEELVKGPDYGESAAQLHRIVASWQGLEPGVAAKKHLLAFDGDTKIAHEIAARAVFNGLRRGVDTSKPVKRRKLLKSIGAFAKDPQYEGTFAAKLATIEYNRLGLR